ncbi:MAG: hypothetical protein KDA96_24025, partial [Planctomycetaceae bacterium]|nr:hypothetical protein [Planctomycetaceae bacterium]
GAGQSYVSDGYAHALRFNVNGQTPGAADVSLNEGGLVNVQATVAFAPEHPVAVAYGTLDAPQGKRISGDTVNLHAPRDSGYETGGERRVELVVNGNVAASQVVPADGRTHDLMFEIPIRESSWVALRQFPQLHTNPVNVIVDGRPVRASSTSAVWCAESVRLLWDNRRLFIKAEERDAARTAYEKAVRQFRKIAVEAGGDPKISTLPVDLSN